MANEIDFVDVVFVGRPLLFSNIFMHSDPDGEPGVEVRPGSVTVFINVEPCSQLATSEQDTFDNWIRAAIVAAKKELPNLQFDPDLPQ